jgi:hypothetical protein
MGIINGISSVGALKSGSLTSWVHILHIGATHEAPRLVVIHFQIVLHLVEHPAQKIANIPKVRILVEIRNSITFLQEFI